ncbi:hypothetical protein FMM05_00955 [Flavobacterium zepuense]|uniref:Lipoprotein n=1 Tax=Flavobacterium zepuense TaxID=2593302 RepID=A0A552V9T2_9FLAO|nr:hypothetical protein [Flavobacterium zepuense]TRW27237.1 hypothetical protein FMM05_00955 [Flavobacterium zepuense]
MKKFFSTLVLLVLLSSLVTGCGNDDLTPLYEEQSPGKIVIRGYSALQDSIQVFANGELLEIGEQNAFKGDIITDYEFVFYNKKTEALEIVNKVSGSVLHSYSFPATTPIDTLSFYVKEGIWIDNVLAFQPGTLTATGRTGYRFIFPTLNRYSNSGYDGPIDAIIKKTNGQVLGISQNITKEGFSTFAEFAFAPPPVINVELVKHGTTESYITGQQVIVQMVMQNNKSRLIVLDEKANESGAFSGVEGTINLVDYFDF